MENFGFKELYSVDLKATFNIEINGQTFEAGETLLNFDKIQFSTLKEDKIRKSAVGGYGNQPLIIWETTSDVQFNFSQGVISKIGFALLSNSKLVEKKQYEDNILVPKKDILGVSNFKIILSQIPESKVFLYDTNTGEKLTYIVDSEDLTGKTLIISTASVEVLADYHYNYTNGGSTLTVGERLINGFISLEGKTRLKDDTDGHEKTGIIRIPKLRLMSDLSMRLGSNVNSPVMNNFGAMGYPVGNRHAQHVLELEILNDDIDADF